MEIGSRSWAEKELTNRIWTTRPIDQCDWSIFSI